MASQEELPSSNQPEPETTIAMTIETPPESRMTERSEPMHCCVAFWRKIFLVCLDLQCALECLVLIIVVLYYALVLFPAKLFYYCFWGTMELPESWTYFPRWITNLIPKMTNDNGGNNNYNADTTTEAENISEDEDKERGQDGEPQTQAHTGSA